MTPQQSQWNLRPGSRERVTVRGKFLFEGDGKFWIKGVTYGTFRPDRDNVQFPEQADGCR